MLVVAFSLVGLDIPCLFVMCFDRDCSKYSGMPFMPRHVFLPFLNVQFFFY